MIRKIVLFLIVVLLAVPHIFADEGMWLPFMLKLRMEKMKQMGLKLSAEEIYSINSSSLKDAIVSLDNGGCTAEIISAKGLMLTNHHCAFEDIQFFSTTENDYLTNGFWAKSLDQELPVPEKTATFLISAADVTTRIKEHLTPDLNRSAADAMIKQVSDEIISEAVGQSHYDATVESFFNGNQYILLITETFTDIRFVGAPPSSIGKFGGDTDNWVWPRHTGDFSLYRVYMSPNGKPATYAKENIPYSPKHFLPISLNGIKPGDFAMILGYPGTTDRFSTSWGVDQTMNITNRNRTEVRNIKLAIIKDAMDKSHDLKLKYAAIYAESSNYYKYSIGQNEGLINLDVKLRKTQTEDSLRNWINADSERIQKYGECLNLIQKAYETNKALSYMTEYWFETLWQGTELLPFTYENGDLYPALVGDGEATLNEVVDKLKLKSIPFFKSFDSETDRKLLTAMIQLYRKNVTSEFQPSVFEIIDSKFNGDVKIYVDAVFQLSVFTDQSRYSEFLKAPDIETIDNDPLFVMVRATLGVYFSLDAQIKPAEEDLKRGQQLYTEALLKMNSQREYYPDANSTMRLTYGKVCDYEPRDAVIYKYNTTLDGYFEKGKIANEDYVTDNKLATLYKNKDFGRYSQTGKMPFCFITDNDITGGNSGSPVINGNGELIGLAFDGNWEAMSGDIIFEPAIQRTVNLDIRFVVFMIDKYADAQNLMNELSLRN